MTCKRRRCEPLALSPWGDRLVTAAQTGSCEGRKVPVVLAEAVSHGTDLFALRDVRGRSLLHIALAAPRLSGPAIAALLRMCPALALARDHEGRTVFHSCRWLSRRFATHVIAMLAGAIARIAAAKQGETAAARDGFEGPRFASVQEAWGVLAKAADNEGLSAVSAVRRAGCAVRFPLEALTAAARITPPVYDERTNVESSSTLNVAVLWRLQRADTAWLFGDGLPLLTKYHATAAHPAVVAGLFRHFALQRQLLNAFPLRPLRPPGEGTGMGVQQAAVGGKEDEDEAESMGFILAPITALALAGIRRGVEICLDHAEAAAKEAAGGGGAQGTPRALPLRTEEGTWLLMYVVQHHWDDVLQRIVQAWWWPLVAPHVHWVDVLHVAIVCHAHACCMLLLQLPGMRRHVWSPAVMKRALTDGETRTLDALLRTLASASGQAPVPMPDAMEQPCSLAVAMRQHLECMAVGGSPAHWSLLQAHAALPPPSSAAMAAALHAAARAGRVDALRFLLTYGVSPDATVDAHRWTALHVAALNQKAAAVRLLLERGASADARTTAGDTPLDVAGARDGDVDWERLRPAAQGVLPLLARAMRTLPHVDTVLRLWRCGRWDVFPPLLSLAARLSRLEKAAVPLPQRRPGTNVLARLGGSRHLLPVPHDDGVSLLTGVHGPPLVPLFLDALAAYFRAAVHARLSRVHQYGIALAYRLWWYPLETMAAPILVLWTAAGASAEALWKGVNRPEWRRDAAALARLEDATTRHALRPLLLLRRLATRRTTDHAAITNPWARGIARLARVPVLRMQLETCFVSANVLHLLHLMRDALLLPG